MKDDASTIFTGVLIHSEIQRQNAEKRKEQEDRSDKLDQANQDLQKKNSKIQKQTNLLREENEDLEDEVQDLRRANQSLYNQGLELVHQVEELHKEVQLYKVLLSKPMAEIAEQNGNFKETYEKQMEMMAEWMVSQKAFKELAIQFGAEKRLSPEDVIKQGNDKRVDVLDNKHDISHNTNVEGSSVVTPERAKKLKEKIRNS